MDRIDKLCSYLSPCVKFADIGCDHGYCTQYMLGSGLCRKAIIADISAKSLSKAERLLKKYVDSGICTAVCCDGLSGIDRDCDLVLIAGMGGEEIVKILKQGFIPRNFVFQPMHNEADLRKYLLNSGCSFSYDGIFYSDGKYYFVIKGSNCGGSAAYTPAQIAYGRDSIGTQELNTMLFAELAKVQEYLTRNLSKENREQLTKKEQFIKGVLSGELT